MANLNFIVTLLILLHCTSAFADSIHGCGGFIEASSSLIKSRKASDSKLDYSHITIELQTLDGLVKDRTQCAPNGYYFIPVYDKGSFIIKVQGPEGWSWEPEKVPIVVDHTGCNANEDINFRFTGFSLSGRVLGAVGGQSCQLKNGGPSNVAVELLSSTDDSLFSVLTSTAGDYSFKNVAPGKYKLRASHPDMNVEVRGPTEVELGFENGVIGDIFSVPGYEVRGLVVAQGNPSWEFTFIYIQMMSWKLNVPRVLVMALGKERLSVMLYLMQMESLYLRLYHVGFMSLFLITREKTQFLTYHHPRWL